MKGIFSSATKQVYMSVSIDRHGISADSDLLLMPELKIEMEGSRGCKEVCVTYLASIVTI